MKNHLLASFSPPIGREIAFLPGLHLTSGRLHEFCGFSRRMLAVILARAMDGPVFWLRPARQVERLHGDALAGLGGGDAGGDVGGDAGGAFPGRFTFVTPRRDLDLLWSMEEILRAGIVPLVICELPAIPDLTPVRRLHLAARAGARGKAPDDPAPLGVILLAGAGGAPGVESRWHMAPMPLVPTAPTAGSPRPDTTPPAETACWRLERRRARMQPPRGWKLCRQGRDFTLHPPDRQDAPVAGASTGAWTDTWISGESGKPGRRPSAPAPVGPAIAGKT